MVIVFDLDDTLYDLSEPFRRAHRELFEETGIISNQFEQIGYNVCDNDKCIFYNVKFRIASSRSERY